MNIKARKKSNFVFLSALLFFTVSFFGSNNSIFASEGLLTDLGHESTFFLRLESKDAILLAGTAAGTLFCMALDEEAKTSVNTLRGDFMDSLQNGDFFGDGYFTLGLAGTFFILGGKKEKKVCENVLESFLETGLMLTVLKTGFGRARPDSSLGVARYNPFGFTGDSFPSGHTGIAFSTAAVLDRAYGIGCLTYPLAAFTGFCRMYKDKHWLSDVFLGAVIGTVIGNMHSVETKDSSISFGLDFNEQSGEGMSSLNYKMKVKF